MKKDVINIAKLDLMMVQFGAMCPIIHSRRWMFPEMYSDLLNQMERVTKLKEDLTIYCIRTSENQ